MRKRSVFFMVMAIGGIALASGPLTFEDRVKAQEAIERVYCNHRIWPKENPGPKPPYEQMITRTQITAKVEDYLKKSAALDKFWPRPISADQLQAEMDRMAMNTKDPETLRELFAALLYDPYVIAECLARPILADRLIRTLYSSDLRFHSEMKNNADAAYREAHEGSFEGWFEKENQHWTEAVNSLVDLEPPKQTAEYFLPQIQASNTTGSCSELWLNTSMEVPDARFGHTAVWTGTEMIVWGGDNISYLNTGGRYNPSTDSWISVSTGANCPQTRGGHTAVWTGTEMIVWGGRGYVTPCYQDGGRYNPSTDTWTTTSIGANCPSCRTNHTAVWTGTAMIIWGGYDGTLLLNSGAMYYPFSDSWMTTSTGAYCPSARYEHTAVWTGTLMIIWGGEDTLGSNTGGRYDPQGDAWTPTSTGSNCPYFRYSHTVIWTGSEMVVWGGYFYDSSPNYLNTGGRYNPSSNTWAPVSTGLNCPSARASHTAVWTGSQMVVWGGYDGINAINSGARYNPVSNAWTSMTAGANWPSSRFNHTAVWTGEEMIIWGGKFNAEIIWPYENTGGRYNPSADTWTPTFSDTTRPYSREVNTAVWTGLELIIWGGNGGANFNDGGRYLPWADTWTATSTGPNCPSARIRHSAIWTGQEMIMWGGDCWDGNHHYQNSGGKYNPFSDTWLPTSMGGDCPSARVFHSVVWTGTEMVVWGGGETAPYFNTGGRYNPSSDTWSSTSKGTN